MGAVYNLPDMWKGILDKLMFIKLIAKPDLTYDSAVWRQDAKLGRVETRALTMAVDSLHYNRIRYLPLMSIEAEIIFLAAQALELNDLMKNRIFQSTE